MVGRHITGVGHAGVLPQCYSSVVASEAGYCCMKVIVVGGASGLTCAHLLSRSHEVLLLEWANDRLGGHSHTVTTDFYGKPIAVDTGFIVYNQRTYLFVLSIARRVGCRGASK